MSKLLHTASVMLLGLSQSMTPPPPAPSVPAPPGVPTPKDATERMKLAARTNGLLGLDFPWHLKATYQVVGDDGKATDEGVYEEWRVSKDQYRIALHSPLISVEEFGTDHGVFLTGTSAWRQQPLSLFRL